MGGLSLVKMEDNPTPLGKAAVTILAAAGSFTLNGWLSTIASIVSITVGLLTIYILIRKIRKGQD